MTNNLSTIIAQGKEYYEKAKKLLDSGDYELELNTLRKSLECFLKGIIEYCNLSYDEKTTTLVSIIDNLESEEIINNKQAKIMHQLRKLTNTGSHVSVEGKLPSDNDGVKALELMKNVSLIVENIISNADITDAVKNENNIPMEYPDYFMTSRPFYQRWAGKNKVKREDDSTYARLVREAKSGNIESALNLAIGVYEKEGDNFEYYMWTFKAALEASKKPIDKIPLKYITTALYEAILFAPTMIFLFDKEYYVKLTQINRMRELVDFYRSNLIDSGNSFDSNLEEIPNNRLKKYFSINFVESVQKAFLEKKKVELLPLGEELRELLYVSDREYVEKDFDTGNIFMLRPTVNDIFDVSLIVCDEFERGNIDKIENVNNSWRYLDDVLYEFGYKEKINIFDIKKIVELFVFLIEKYLGKMIIAEKIIGRSKIEESVDNANYIFECLCGYKVETEKVFGNNKDDITFEILQNKATNNVKQKIYNLFDDRIVFLRNIGCKIKDIKSDIIEKELQNKLYEEEEYRKQKVLEEEKQRKQKKKKFVLGIISLLLIILLFGVLINENIKKEKRQSKNKDVLGVWYRTSLYENDIYKMELNISDNGELLCLIDDNSEGNFTYNNNILKIETEDFSDVVGVNTDKKIQKSKKNDEHLYCRNKYLLLNYKNKKLCQILKDNICGKYSTILEESLEINDEGTWIHTGKWIDSSSGKWKIIKKSVQLCLCDYNGKGSDEYIDFTDTNLLDFKTNHGFSTYDNFFTKDIE